MKFINNPIFIHIIFLLSMPSFTMELLQQRFTKHAFLSMCKLQPQQLTDLHKAAFFANFDFHTISLIHEIDEHGRNCLHYVAMNNNLAFARKLIEHRVNINAEDNEGKTPLYLASALNAKATANLLLAQGAEPNIQTHEGNTPLHQACFHGNEMLVQILLKKGANKKLADEHGFTPIHVAAQVGQIKVLELLLTGHSEEEIKDLVNGRDKLGATPFYLACQDSKVEMARVLLAKGANPDIPTSKGDAPIHLAAITGDVEMIKFLIEAKAKTCFEYDMRLPLEHALIGGHFDATMELLAATPPTLINDRRLLSYAAKFGGKRILSALLQKKARLMGTPGLSDLHIAAIGGYKDVIMYLLSEPNADINAPDSIEGCSPLSHAIIHGHWDVADFLLSKGAKKSPNSDMLLSLWNACRQGQFNWVKRLLELGVDVTFKDNVGLTALHWACTSSAEGSGALIEFLVANGAQIEAQDNDGRRPLHLAAKSGNLTNIQALAKLGADSSALTNKGLDAAGLAFANFHLPAYFTLTAIRPHCNDPFLALMSDSLTFDPIEQIVKLRDGLTIECLYNLRSTQEAKMQMDDFFEKVNLGESFWIKAPEPVLATVEEKKDDMPDLAPKNDSLVTPANEIAPGRGKNYKKNLRKKSKLKALILEQPPQNEPLSVEAIGGENSQLPTLGSSQLSIKTTKLNPRDEVPAPPSKAPQIPVKKTTVARGAPVAKVKVASNNTPPAPPTPYTIMQGENLEWPKFLNDEQIATLREHLRDLKNWSSEEVRDDISKIAGGKGFYRLRIGGLRIIFSVDKIERLIKIHKLGLRKNIYKNL